MQKVCIICNVSRRKSMSKKHSQHIEHDKSTRALSDYADPADSSLAFLIWRKDAIEYLIYVLAMICYPADLLSERVAWSRSSG